MQGPGFDPGQGTRSHMPPPRPSAAKENLKKKKKKKNDSETLAKIFPNLYESVFFFNSWISSRKVRLIEVFLKRFFVVDNF